MSRKFVIFAAAVAAFAFATQGAEAHGRKKVDPRITATAVGVGAASTAAFFALNDWRWKWTKPHGVTALGAWGATALGCAALSPIVATAVVQRPLKYREAHILMGSCVVPIVGGWLVNEAYNAHWLTAPDEEQHHGKKKHRHAKK